jgi:hypothetical protein
MLSGDPSGFELSSRRCRCRAASYHSCRNRHGPKTHRDQTERWLDAWRSRLLPCPYFLLTFTLPQELRPLARAHQKVVYGALMRSAAGALQELTADPRYLGARPGMIAVLHTWTRDMLYHPHVHVLVTAGGLEGAGERWVASRNLAFLLPCRALSVIFRAKVRDALRATGLAGDVRARTWRRRWVVHCQHAGTGEKVLGYLGRYLYRIAIANSRLESFDGQHVVFRYRDGRSGAMKRCRIDAMEFVRRFLQHVLPRGFVKVRSYGLYSTSSRPALEHARGQLAHTARGDASPSDCASALASGSNETGPQESEAIARRICPRCGLGHMHVVADLLPTFATSHHPIIRAPP